MTESSFREIEFKHTDIVSIQIREDSDFKGIYLASRNSVIIIPFSKAEEFIEWFKLSVNELNEQL